MAKHSVQISDDILYGNIVNYCKLNKLKINEFITDLLKKQFAIEQYGDTPFSTYEIPIIDNSPVPSLTGDITIEKPNEDEIVYLPTISIPYTIEENTPLITNGNGNLNKKYIKTRVPSDFYGEIKTESESKVEKPKKRRL